MLMSPRKCLSSLTIFLENLLDLQKLVHPMNGPVERGVSPFDYMQLGLCLVITSHCQHDSGY